MLGTTYTSGDNSMAVPQPNTCSPGRDVNHCYCLVGALNEIERDLESEVDLQRKRSRREGKGLGCRLV